MFGRFWYLSSLSDLGQLFTEVIRWTPKTAHVSKRLEKKGAGLQAHRWQLGSSKTHNEGHAKTSARTIPGKFGGEGTSSNHLGSVVFMACKRRRNSSLVWYGGHFPPKQCSDGKVKQFQTSWWVVMNSLSSSASSCKEGTQSGEIQSSPYRSPTISKHLAKISLWGLAWFPWEWGDSRRADELILETMTILVPFVELQGCKTQEFSTLFSSAMKHSPTKQVKKGFAWQSWSAMAHSCKVRCRPKRNTALAFKISGGNLGVPRCM